MPTHRPHAVRNIVFDWSGTLMNDLPAVWQASNHCLRLAGRSEMSLDHFRAAFELPFEGFYRRHLPDVPLSQLEAWFMECFAREQSSIQPLPYSRQFLDFCRARGIRSLLVSAIHHRHFAEQNARHGLDRLLDHHAVGIRDKRQVLRTLLEQHRMAPAETIMIGDMTHDLDAARSAGIRAVAVLTGYTPLDSLRAAGPDLIVEHLGELEALLDRHHQHLPVARPPEANPRPVATVGALIFNDAGHVLMVQTHKWSNLWGIPGGKIERDEPAEAALVREVLEETALNVHDLRFVMVQDCIGSREFHRDAHFLLLNYTARAPGNQTVTLNHEAQAWQWLDPNAALALPLNTPTRVLLERVLGLTT